jgi:hypothetical protein
VLTGLERAFRVEHGRAGCHGHDDLGGESFGSARRLLRTDAFRDEPTTSFIEIPDQWDHAVRDEHASRLGPVDPGADDGVRRRFRAAERVGGEYAGRRSP